MKRNTYEFKVAGVTFDNRQGYIQYLRKHPEAFLVYNREPGNRYDKNAITIGGYVPGEPTGKYVPIGYVPKEIAKEIAPLIDKGYKIYTHAYEITGGYGLNLGVRISMSLFMPRQQAVRYLRNK